ncbi:glycosyltransferase [Desulfomicrobium escambiense]|uniref:glycosyltransferase n=1 Tax=Desulfomicrobium escambiense TaxID=29503 RepID=UPI00040B5673|nr:glycosyltransferase [Desulfomicrobium escambiense]
MDKIFDRLLISCPNGGGFFLLHGGKLRKIDSLHCTGLDVVGASVLRGLQPRAVALSGDNTWEVASEQVLFDDIHDVLLAGESCYIVGTMGNEVIRLDSQGREIQRWTFSESDDSWHINCLAQWHGTVVYSAFGEFASTRGYKMATEGAGFVRELTGGRTLIEGLSQPHSLVPDGERLLLANSEQKEIREYDSEMRLLRRVVLSGYTRGICVGQDLLYVGLSCSRNIEDSGLNSATVVALDRSTWEERGRIELPVREIYGIKQVADTDTLVHALGGLTECTVSRLTATIDTQVACNSKWMNCLRSVVPKVSVITVNFNGLAFLPGLIDSLLVQSLPPAEIIVVDNASTDGSADFLRQAYPFVKVVRSERNLGFAGGNNLGVQAASSSLLALINNDTVVDPDWLELLVGTWVSRTADGDSVGAVSPKIRFFNRFLSFRLRCQVFTPEGGDTRALGAAIEFSSTHICGVGYIKPLAVSGFYDEEKWSSGRVVRWTCGDAELMLPVNEDAVDTPLRLYIVASVTGRREEVELEVECEGVPLGSCRLTEHFARFEIDIPTDLRSAAAWVINNAGSQLDEYGTAADIGINQPDRGQFDGVRDCEAFCGCSVLMPRHVFLKLGGFDPRFFMYYEDTDLSWRMRKNGLKIAFQPFSVVRHIHAGSSGEWSPSFRYHVTRNYRLNGLKNAEGSTLFVLLARLVYAFLRRAMQGKCRNLRHTPTGPLEDMEPSRIEFVALLDVISMTPGILLRRFNSLFGNR